MFIFNLLLRLQKKVTQQKSKKETADFKDNKLVLINLDR